MTTKDGGAQLDSSDVAPANLSKRRISDDLLTREALALELERSVRTLDRWDKLRIGPPRVTVMRTVFYRRSAVVAWLEANERKPVRRHLARQSFSSATETVR